MFGANRADIDVGRAMNAEKKPEANSGFQER
jgi:hypothetical protein